MPCGRFAPSLYTYREHMQAGTVGQQIRGWRWNVGAQRKHGEMKGDSKGKKSRGLGWRR